MRQDSAQAGGRPLRVALCLALLCALAACSSRPTSHGRAHYAPSGRYYPPPGPPGDPWGPYIKQASGRFGIPELWVRQVMRQESGGQQQAISSAGAMGLMQVMPDTYAELQARYGLGDDPYEPRDNILAGTAYLREMYDRYGAPGFLAAYNAGPRRLEAYLYRGVNLPTETVNYVASIAPRLGPSAPLSGPLAVYADSGRRYAARPVAGGCDPDAAYDPGRPCAPRRPAAVVTPVAVAASAAPVGIAASAAPVAVASAGFGCDPDVAYDPSRPCVPRPSAPATPVLVAASAASGGCDPDAAFDPSRPCAPRPRTEAPLVVAAPVVTGPCDPDAAFDPTRRCLPAPAGGAIRAVAAAGGAWGIQVGAYTNTATARLAVERARGAAPDLLREARAEFQPTTPRGGAMLYRARLSGLSARAASDACGRLSQWQVACMVVRPGEGESF